MKEFNTEVFSRRLKSLREERGMDQDSLAEVSGISKVSISRYENGASIPRIDMAVSLARALDCSCDVLIGVVPLAVS